MTKSEIEKAKAKAVKAYKRTMGTPENSVQEALRDGAVATFTRGWDAAVRALGK